MGELKPCPLCGSKFVATPLYYIHECDRDKACPLDNVRLFPEDVAAWNRGVRGGEHG